MLQKQNLTRANEELFRRSPDEAFISLDHLFEHCKASKERASDLWKWPNELEPVATEQRLQVTLSHDAVFSMNDWSFGQLCQLGGVSKETVNRLSPDTARRVLTETLPEGNRPFQVFTSARMIRSFHGTNYTRLYNADLVDMVRGAAPNFGPAQEAAGGGSGLYCGEQDMFCFMIDPLGWIEIEGEAFAPGFFLWNSEVGRRSVGVQTFWFQAICQNHIVWDAVEVIEFSRKHTVNVRESLDQIRCIIEGLVRKRDARRDSFAKVIVRAMSTSLGQKPEDILKVLSQNGIPKGIGQEALKMAESTQRFTIFSIVDALTRIAGRSSNAGERTDIDLKAGALLALAA